MFRLTPNQSKRWISGLQLRSISPEIAELDRHLVTFYQRITEQKRYSVNYIQIQCNGGREGTWRRGEYGFFRPVLKRSLYSTGY